MLLIKSAVEVEDEIQVRLQIFKYFGGIFELLFIFSRKHGLKSRVFFILRQLLSTIA